MLHGRTDLVQAFRLRGLGVNHVSLSLAGAASRGGWNLHEIEGALQSRVGRRCLDAGELLRGRRKIIGPCPDPWSVVNSLLFLMDFGERTTVDSSTCPRISGNILRLPPRSYALTQWSMKVSQSSCSCFAYGCVSRCSFCCKYSSILTFTSPPVNGGSTWCRIRSAVAFV